MKKIKIFSVASAIFLFVLSFASAVFATEPGGGTTWTTVTCTKTNADGTVTVTSACNEVNPNGPCDIKKDCAKGYN